MYVALVRVGEASGSLDQVLEVLAAERSRAEALRRKLGDALRYPLFVLCAAACVLLFFLIFVLPQFATVLQDFGAKLDPIVLGFLDLSKFLRAQSTMRRWRSAALSIAAAGCCCAGRACAPRHHDGAGAAAAVCAMVMRITAPRCSAAISACCSAAAST